MAVSPLGPHQSSPEELRDLLAAHRRGTPFLVYRDGDGAQRILELSPERAHVTVGRSPDCDLALAWDPRTSRLHAELRCVGGAWVVADDGLSSNGTFVAERRIRGRHRLADGDVVRVGDTLIAFAAPSARAVATTLHSPERERAVHVTDAQRRVLIALCRPFKGATEAAPATNPQIARELVVTVGAVKAHMRALFEVFGIDALPQQEKRRRLVTLAFATGLVRERDL